MVVLNKPHLPAKELVVFATIAAGGGHVATANAMAQALLAHYPETYDVQISDLMLELGFTVQDKRHKESWNWMLANPWSARWGQRALSLLPAATRRYHRLLLRAFARAAAGHFNNLGPKLVIANHGWLVYALQLAKEKYGLRAPVLNFATEPLDASALWAEWKVARYAVPSQDTAQDLMRFGVPEAKIDLLGYPVQQAFLSPIPKAQARAALDLPDAPICVVSLGGEGVARDLQSFLNALQHHPNNPLTVVLCGRNTTLKRQLEPLQRVIPVAFTAQMPLYLAAADVVIGKAGPASSFEALAMGKPLLFTSYAGLNEAKIVRYGDALGVSRYAPTPQQLGDLLGSFLRPEKAAEVARLTAKLKLPQAAEGFAHYLHGICTQGFPAAPQIIAPLPSMQEVLANGH